MTAGSADLGIVIAAWTGAGLLWLLELGLSVALLSTVSLNRVTLQRLSGMSEGRITFLNEAHNPGSSYRIAAGIARHVCAVVATVLAILAAAESGWRSPVLTGGLLGIGVGVVLVETILARSIALLIPRRALVSTAFLLVASQRLLAPIAVPLARMGRRHGPGAETAADRSEAEQDEAVEALIEVGERSGVLEAEEVEMVRGIVDLDETLAREIMTPLGDLRLMEVETTVAEATGELLDAAHTRIPVYEERLDNVVGVLHARDLLRAWHRGEQESPLRPLLRAVTFVHESDTAADLLQLMRQKAKLALVMDEFGGISGLVTIEDLFEEIVGEIHDEERPAGEVAIVAEGDGACRCLTTARIDDLAERFDVEIEDANFDTVGGWIVYRVGRLPRRGESFSLDGLQVEVIEADRRRVKTVRVCKDDEAEAVGTGS